VEVIQEHRTSNIETVVLDPDTRGRQMRARRLSAISKALAVVSLNQISEKYFQRLDTGAVYQSTLSFGRSSRLEVSRSS